jgi:hypothetical protein
LTTAAKKPRIECSCQPVAIMMVAMDVPSDSRSIPSTISFFETLATDDFADAGFATDPNDSVFGAITRCLADRGTGFDFIDFDCRLRAAI